MAIYSALILGISIVYIILGFAGCAKSVRMMEIDEYFLENRKVGFWPLMLTILATHLGGGVIIGTSDLAYDYASLGFMYSAGIVLGLIGLSLGFAQKLRDLELKTIPEIYEKVYDSKVLRSFCSIISATVLAAILLALILSAKKFLIAVNIDSAFVFYFMWAAIIFYTLLGGLRAIIITDVFQIILVMLICVYIFFKTVIDTQIGVEVVFDPSLIKSDYSISFTEYLILPFIFCFIEQDIAQRIFAAKDRSVAALSAFWAGIALLFFSIIPVYFGIVAQKIGIERELGGVFIQVVASYNSEIMIGIVGLAILAAIVSTSDSILCSISSNLSYDLMTSPGSANQITKSRLITFSIGITVLVAEKFFNNILGVILKSYGLFICTFSVSIFAALFMPHKVSKRAAIFSVLIGFITYGISFFIDFPSSEVIALSFSAIVYISIYKYVGPDEARVEQVVEVEEAEEPPEVEETQIEEETLSLVITDPNRVKDGMDQRAKDKEKFDGYVKQVNGHEDGDEVREQQQPQPEPLQPQPESPQPQPESPQPQQKADVFAPAEEQDQPLGSEIKDINVDINTEQTQKSPPAPMEPQSPPPAVETVESQTPVQSSDPQPEEIQSPVSQPQPSPQNIADEVQDIFVESDLNPHGESQQDVFAEPQDQKKSEEEENKLSEKTTAENSNKPKTEDEQA